MILCRLVEVLDALTGCDPGELSSGEDLLVLEQQRSRLEAVVARAAARFEAEDGHAGDGARTAAAWLTARTHKASREVRAELALGRQLRSLPGFEAAVLDGSVSPAHVRPLAPFLGGRTRERLQAHEPFLVEKAKELTFREYEQVVAYLGQHVDPDGTEEAAEARRERRDAWLYPGIGGTYVGKLTLDPIAGAIVEGELGRLADDLHEADVAAAKAALGRDPLPGELARTPAQRRADALVEMARRSAGCPSDARFPAPLVSVLVDFPTLAGRICELANGTVVSPGSVLAYLDEALVERAVWHGRTRIEVGARTRLFTGATRRAVELRDRVCQHPTCEVPFERCEVDHVVPYEHGGETTQENGRVLCGWHNRLRNRSPDPPGEPGGASGPG